MHKYNNWILSHEHLSIDFSHLKDDPDTSFRDEEAVREEFRALKQKGLSHVIDVSTIGMKRNEKMIASFYEKTGIKVIRATGLYKTPFIPEQFLNYSVPKLIKYFENDIDKIDLFGEIGTSNQTITNIEQKTFYAIAHLSKQYHKPIYTHTTLGKQTMQQVSILLEQQVNPQQVVIGHQDLNENSDEVIAIAKLGFYIGIDTIGKNNYASDQSRIDLIQKLVTCGFENQIILSMDITRKSQLKSHGGIGYSYIIDKFLPALAKVVDDEIIKKIMINNPRKVFGIK